MQSPHDKEPQPESVQEEWIAEEFVPESEPETESATAAVGADELENLRKEVTDYRHKYLHLLADSDNARKRLLKDREEITLHSTRTLLLDFLNPIDHLENALRYTEEASPEVKHWATGFKMILTQFKEVLANNGVKPIESVGKEFDPHFHEAIEMVETEEHPPGTVVQESIKGYTMRGKTLRPARVKVSKAPEPMDDAPELEAN